MDLGREFEKFSYSVDIEIGEEGGDDVNNDLRCGPIV